MVLTKTSSKSFFRFSTKLRGRRTRTGSPSKKDPTPGLKEPESPNTLQLAGDRQDTATTVKRGCLPNVRRRMQAATGARPEL
jgi:hypothetical protein